MNTLACFAILFSSFAIAQSPDSFENAMTAVPAPETTSLSPKELTAINLTSGRSFKFSLNKITLSKYSTPEPEFRFVFVFCLKNKCSSRGNYWDDAFSRFIMDSRSKFLNVERNAESPFKISNIIESIIDLSAIDSDYEFGIKAYEHHSFTKDTYLGEVRFNLESLRNNPILSKTSVIKNKSGTFEAILGVNAY